MQKKIKSIRMDCDTIERIQKIAKKENRTFSNVVNTILKEQIKNEASI